MRRTVSESPEARALRELRVARLCESLKGRAEGDPISQALQRQYETEVLGAPASEAIKSRYAEDATFRTPQEKVFGEPTTRGDCGPAIAAMTARWNATKD